MFLSRQTPENEVFEIAGASLDARENRSAASDNFRARSIGAGDRELRVFRGFPQ